MSDVPKLIPRPDIRGDEDYFNPLHPGLAVSPEGWSAFLRGGPFSKNIEDRRNESLSPTGNIYFQFRDHSPNLLRRDGLGNDIESMVKALRSGRNP